MGWALMAAAEPHHRKGWIKRFDPRFWTVDFARPMMASVTSAAPGALRIETVFYRKQDLAGLIWEAADRWDHPLLAYETKRDFRHAQLKFRWRSGGVKPLDALHGPTLTIEGAMPRGAARAMVGGELLQFGIADIIEPGLWRLSRLLRGRAGTASHAVHAAGAPFVLLDDPASLMLPDDLAALAEGGGTALQWAPRGGTALTDAGIDAADRALRPLAPVHGQIRPDGAGGVTISWIRRSRVDTGWRDHVDQPPGESREAWRIALSPPVAGIAPWERSSPMMNIGAAELAALPPGCAVEIRQAGDFALSPPLTLPLT